ncbi:MAG: helix-turn-helix domain-containing protein [Oscillospiraceae bacterium]|nr:helix-turn-helix domain-containing protein [Oscillospiraceae bacterium]
MDNNFQISNQVRDKLIANLVEELPVLRLKTGLSQDELANLLDISRQTYSSIETKKRKMSWTLYLSLILFFYHNEMTHEIVAKSDYFPKSIIQYSDSNNNNSLSSFVSMDNDDIRNYLDDQAIHAIQTVIMMEYARCNHLSGEAVVKSFDGRRMTLITEQDIRARVAFEEIKNKSEKNEQ